MASVSEGVSAACFRAAKSIDTNEEEGGVFVKPRDRVRPVLVNAVSIARGDVQEHGAIGM